MSLNRYGSILAFLVLCCPVIGQNLDSFEEAIFTGKQGELPYRIQMPKHYNPDIKYPLLLFLHGSGERGSDNKMQLKHGGTLFANDSVRSRHAAIVVFPQCPEEKSWANAVYFRDGDQGGFAFPRAKQPNAQQKLLEGLLDELIEKLPVNEDRIYIGGLSMGAMGTYELVRRNPRKFAAAFAICGGANPAIAGKLKRLPWWIFHGTADKVVPIRYNEQLVESMRRQDISVMFTKYPDVGHDSWTQTFANPELLDWLFAQSKE